MCLWRPLRQRHLLRYPRPFRCCLAVLWRQPLRRRRRGDGRRPLLVRGRQPLRRRQLRRRQRRHRRRALRQLAVLRRDHRRALRQRGFCRRHHRRALRQRTCLRRHHRRIFWGCRTGRGRGRTGRGRCRQQHQAGRAGGGWRGGRGRGGYDHPGMGADGLPECAGHRAKWRGGRGRIIHPEIQALPLQGRRMEGARRGPCEVVEAQGDRQDPLHVAAGEDGEDRRQPVCHQICDLLRVEAEPGQREVLGVDGTGFRRGGGRGGAVCLEVRKQGVGRQVQGGIRQRQG
mmetsp:Transcript_103662/g.332237  ORF Transcript_103662/g.332237 Transcript_103662/m.332237 type:complete len:287 (-) Transcript_103662:510-1370(-)